jgi:hypothetical protein
MSAVLLWTSPFALQGVLMGIDELWFHRRRGLPRWERIGHPVDTATVGACILLACLLPLSVGGAWAYTALAVVSCAVVTKDEAIHAARCSPGEHWIHGALFVLHPIVLGVVAVLWSARDGHALVPALEAWTGVALPPAPLAGTLLVGQGAVVAAFGLYQAVYWNRPTARLGDGGCARPSACERRSACEQGGT